MTADIDITEKAMAVAVLNRIQRVVDEEIVLRAIQGLPRPEPSRNMRHAAKVVLRHAQLQSVGNWIQSRVEERLDRLESELVAETKRNDPTKGKEERLFALAELTITNAFNDIQEQTQKDSLAVAAAVAARARVDLKNHHGLDTEKVSLDHLAETPVLGATLKEHFDKMAADLLFRFKAAIRSGVAAEETLPQIIERIEGNGEPVKSDEPGIAEKDAAESLTKRFLIRLRLMDASEGGINKVIQAALTLFSNEAEGEVLDGADEEDEDGEPVRMGWQWVAVLDQATCPQCEFYDGNRWDADFEPVEDAPEFPDEPPLHFNCRCSLVPSNLDDDKEETPDFEHILDSYTREEQESAFGKMALRAYRKGEITANQLIGQRSNLMTLQAFKDAA